MKVYNNIFNMMNLSKGIKNIVKKNKELNIELIKAVKEDNLLSVKSLLEKGANLNYYYNNRTALDYIVENKNLDNKLLELIVSKSDKISLKYLKKALYHKNYNFLISWINYYDLKTLNSTKDEDGNNILHIVSQTISRSESEKSLQYEFIRSLIEKGMDLSNKNSYGKSPLEFFMTSNKINIMDLLNVLEDISKNSVVSQLPKKASYETINSHSITNKKSYSRKEEVKNDENSSSLKHNIEDKKEKPQINYDVSSKIARDKHSKKVHIRNNTHNNHETDEYFMLKNQDTHFNHSQEENHSNHEFKSSLNSTFSSPESFPKKASISKDLTIKFPKSKIQEKALQNAKNFRLLNNIKENKDCNIIEEIINDGANVNYHDEEKKSCLYYAIENNNLKVIELLIKKGADVNFQDNIGYSCLHWAIKHQNYKAVRELLNNEALINLMGKDKIRPIHVAAYHGNVPIFQLLVSQKNTLIDAQDNFGNTALMIAIHKENLNIVTNLLQNDASLSITDKNKNNIFHIAADVNNLEILKKLLKKYNEKKTITLTKRDIINDQDFQGNTPLHIACHKGNTKIIKTLLKNGADFSISNNAKQTPIRILNIFYKLHSNQLNFSEKKDIENILSLSGKKIPSSNIFSKSIMNAATKITSKI